MAPIFEHSLVNARPNGALNTASTIPNSQHRESINDKTEAIAVIGLSLRFPQDATSPESFWELLLQKRSALTKVPKDRFNVDAVYHPNPARLDTLNVRHGHFMKEDVAKFDAPFFSIPVAEALSMDPQQRGLLETTYRAFESAGLSMDDVVGSSTSVYIGSFAREYDVMALRDSELPSKYASTGNGPAMLANRVSWFFNLLGASATIDTACSSSLYALHLACQGLRSHETNMAVVGGSNVILNADTLMIPLSNMNFLSPDGISYSFDHRANGYGRGEGFGITILKRLEDAVRDGDTIRAVIRATGLNQDGRTPGISQPSKASQSALIQDTYRSAGLDLGQTRYFEAHGTGTPVGDPIEAGAVADVFKTYRSKDDPLYIGSVKSNIGHLEGASGIAGFIKTVLTLEKGYIPPNIWFEKVNPNISAEKWNIKFPTEATPWPSTGLRRASINSFGFGGANAHVVLDDAYHYLRLRGLKGVHRTVGLPSEGHLGHHHHATRERRQNSESFQEEKQADTILKPKLFVWSFADKGGLERWRVDFQQYLSGRLHGPDKPGDNYLEDLAYTLSNKRGVFPWKSYLVADSVDELYEKLSSPSCLSPTRSTRSPRLAFVFTGQGAQWFAMGRELFVFPVFQQSIQLADEYLRSLGCKWSAIDELCRDEDQSDVNTPALSQALCTILQVALVDLLESWRVSASAVVGHSSGEIAAAYCAGGLSRESAWKTAYFRGVLTSQLEVTSTEKGAMMAVALSLPDVAPYLARLNQLHDQDQVAVGCVNGPKNVTVTGSLRSIDALKEVLDDEAIFCRKLNVTLAYHSNHMLQIAPQYRQLLQGLSPRQVLRLNVEAPKFYSSLKGSRVDCEELCRPEYWVQNLVSMVRFSDAVAQMCTQVTTESTSAGPDFDSTSSLVECFVEIGPHTTLRRPVQETVVKSALGNAHYYSVLSKNASAMHTSMELAGLLFCQGYKLDIAAINSHGCANRQPQMLIDLPEYPFNHTHSYWLEGRISKGYRFRSHPRHELLGARSSDWNPLEAKWRNIIRVSDNSWIEDHKFNGSELYPASGMIVMAIEAAKQLANNALKIKGIKIRDLVFKKALILSMEPEGVEVQFYMRPQPAAPNSTSDTYSFRLCEFLNDQWIDICSGTVITEYQSAGYGIERIDETELLIEACKNKTLAGIKRCKKVIEKRDYYDSLAAVGFEFGPCFRTLRNITHGDNEAAASIDMAEWSRNVTDNNIHNHVIHPTAMDAIMQITAAVVQYPEPMIPTKIEDMWISGDLISNGGAGELKVYVTPCFQGYRERDFNIVVLIAAHNQPVIMMENYRSTRVGGLTSSTAPEARWRRLCFELDWKPDLDMLTAQELSAYCNREVTNLDVSALIEEVELACLYFLHNAHEKITQAGSNPIKRHLQKYILWAVRQANSRNGKDFLSTPKGRRILQDESYRNYFLEGLKNSGPIGNLIVTVGEHLTPILSEKIDPLEILFTQPLAENFYKSELLNVNYFKICEYVDLLAHKNPNMNVMEIGAGTGGATRHILETLAHPRKLQNGTPRYNHYDYTDISSKFFADAAEEFKSQEGRISFKVLDISKDPLSQGFQTEEYDLIVAANVLHATSDIEHTLFNARKMLKPGGKLVVMELSDSDYAMMGFAFGLLPGWWLGEEKYREWGPAIPIQEWNNSLLNSGFSGIDLLLPDTDSGSSGTCCFVMVSHAIKAEDSPKVTTPAPILITTECSFQQQIAKQVQQELNQRGISCEIMALDRIGPDNNTGRSCIFLPEMTNPFLSDITEENFARLKIMVQTMSSILWVTRGGCRDVRNPQADIVTGFARSITSENPGLHFATLAIEDTTCVTDVTRFILNIFEELRQTPTQSYAESDYLQIDGLLSIGRLVEARYMNDKIHTKLVKQLPQNQQIEKERALTLTIDAPGLLNTLCFEDDLVHSEPLGANQIEVKVHAAGLTFQDAMIALGQVPSDHIGLEFSGIITRVGKNARRVHPGDRVVGCSPGAFKTYARCDQKMVTIIPGDMTYITAASIPLSFSMAYYSIHEIARLRKGESILIHSGAGGFGQAAIQLAKIIGATIYTTVSTQEKKKSLMEQYCIPGDHIFSSRKLSFAQGIKRLTKNRGVDVVLNSLTGDGLKESWRCVASCGKFIEVGKRDSNVDTEISMSPFSRGAMFVAVDIASLIMEASHLMGPILERVMGLIRKEAVSPPSPLQVYRRADIEEGLRLLQSGKTIGKTVIEFNEYDVVPTIPSRKDTYNFRGDATYVLGGGLGGLGRSTTLWMVRRGAMNIISLSRSGARTEDAMELIRSLREQGVNIVAPPCDVADESRLQSVLVECSKSMPAIRGCIQGAMVLRDSLFENMTCDMFNAALRPKVQGTWNLHKYLPRGMDFFVLLSGAAGIYGNRGQCNYASGNTYQDALARHRVAIGEKCSSIDLGMVLEVGFVAERANIMDTMSSAGSMGTREMEFHAMLDHLCDPSFQESDPLKTNIVTGVASPVELKRKGLDEMPWMKKPLFRHTYQCDRFVNGSGMLTEASQQADIGDLIRKASSQQEAGKVIETHLIKKLSRALFMPEEDIDSSKPVFAYGVDSLVAVELRYWFLAEAGTELTVLQILDNRSIVSLSFFAASKSEFYLPESA